MTVATTNLASRSVKEKAVVCGVPLEDKLHQSELVWQSVSNSHSRSFQRHNNSKENFVLCQPSGKQICGCMYRGRFV